jgi:Tetratricopeptide repeat
VTEADQAETVANALSGAHATARQRAEAGDLTGARTMIEDALAAGELQLGRDDPRLAPLMVDLATLARKLGNLTEARNQLRRAYAIIVTAAGPEHATSLSIEGRLAAVIYRLGEPTEAYDWHLADAGRRVLGTEHPAVRGAQQRLDASAQNPNPPLMPTPPPISWTDQPSEVPDQQGWPGNQGWSDGEGWAPPPEHTYAPVAAGVYQRQGDVQVVAPPPPRAPQDIEVWHEPPLAGSVIAPRQRRGHGGGVALVASLGVVVLVAAVVVGLQFFRPSSSSNGPGPAAGNSSNTVQGATQPTPAPTATAPPPTGVALKDEGGAVTLTWNDPSNGRVPFIISGGREGQALMALVSVDAGRTTSTIYGLNDGVNYCFTVSAVWAEDKITPSIRACTFRLSTSPTS